MSYLVAAYAALWAGVFGYLLWLAGRVRALREEARSLARDAGARDAAATHPPLSSASPSNASASSVPASTAHASSGSASSAPPGR